MLTTTYTENGARLKQRAMISVYRPRNMGGIGGGWNTQPDIHWTSLEPTGI